MLTTAKHHGSALINAGRSTVSGARTAGSKGTKDIQHKSAYLANNAALGRLPTLGLGEIKLEEIGQDECNKFHYHQNTQELLVAREIDRELKDLRKYEKDNLRIWDK